MKFVLMVKQVPDTTMVTVDHDGNLMREGIPSILDPYCEYVLDMIRKLKHGDDEVIAVTMGPAQAKDVLLRCMESVADEAYLLSDRAFAGADTYATARTLAAFVSKFVPDYDYILCGKQAADGDTAQVPAEMARMLCSQQFYYTVDMSRDGDSMTVTQDYGDEVRVCRLPRGSVISVSEGDDSRFMPSIAGYLEASGKPMHVLDRIALGLGAFSVGMKGSMTRIMSSYSPKSDHDCHLVEGLSPVDVAEHLLEVLR